METDTALTEPGDLPARGWLVRHAVFPLLIACGAAGFLSVVLLVLRKVMTGHGRLMFIPFNLLLAFIPLAFLLVLERAWRRRGRDCRRRRNISGFAAGDRAPWCGYERSSGI